MWGLSPPFTHLVGGMKPFDLGAALAAVYDEAAYDPSVNYTEAPPPPQG
ncbi:MAG: hypothetical protein OHK0022_06750 [Roseiflexaceae bacterium]